MINIPICPECGSYTASDLVEINILEEGYRNTYEELYECRCGCKFVVLHPRHLDDEVKIHKIIKEGK